MNLRSDHKDYQKAVKKYLDGLNHKRALAGLTLNQTEQKLISARFFLRQKNFTDSIQTLNSIHFAENKFLLAEKLFLLATNYFLQGEAEKAASLNQEAYENYLLIGDRRGLFLSSYNLSVDYDRLNNLSLNRLYLEKSKNYATNEDEKALIQRAKIFYYIKLNDKAEAIRAIQELEKYYKNLNSADKLSSDVCVADAWVQLNNLDESKKYLKRCLKNRLNRDKPRALLDLCILKCLKENNNYPKLKKEFLTSKELYLKWNLICQLKTGHITEAKKTWNKLCQLLPASFDANFKFKCRIESNSLFGLLIKKLCDTSDAKHNETLSRRPAILIERFMSILTSAPSPLCKEEIIPMLWNESYSNSYDNRFYKLVERLKKKYDIVLTKNYGAYRISSWSRAKNSRT